MERLIDWFWLTLIHMFSKTKQNWKPKTKQQHDSDFLNSDTSPNAMLKKMCFLSFLVIFFQIEIEIYTLTL